MELVRYHSTHGYHMALVVRTGTKWTYLLYMCSTGLTRISNIEARYFKSYGEATKKQLAQFNASSRKFGYSKRRNLAR